MRVPMDGLIGEWGGWLMKKTDVQQKMSFDVVNVCLLRPRYSVFTVVLVLSIINSIISYNLDERANFNITSTQCEHILFPP